MLPALKAIDSPWFGVNLDSGNVDDTDVYTQLQKIVPYAVNVQLKVDTGPVKQKVPTDVPRFVKMLRDANYRGYVVLEYESAPDPYDAIPQAPCRPPRRHRKGLIHGFRHRAVRVHARDVHRPGGHPARLAAAAHAADVADQRDLGDRRRRRDHPRRRAARPRLSTILGAIAVVRLDDQHRQRLPDHRSHAEDVQEEGAAASESTDDRSARLPRLGRAVHPLAQVDERPDDGAPRRLRRRRRAWRWPSSARCSSPTSSATPGSSSRIVLGTHRRRAAVVGAADRRAAADRAVARVRRPGRRPGRHGEVLPVPARRRPHRLPHGRDRRSR